MKSKPLKNILFVVTLLAVLVLLFFLFSKDRKRDVKSVEEGVRINKKTVSLNSQDQVIVVTNSQIPTLPKTKEEVATKLEEVKKRDKEVQVIIEQRLKTPIHFYGKVVDVDGNPVEGAQILYILGNHISWEGSPAISGPATNKNGGFEIISNGMDISVEAQHPDYYNVTKGMVKFEYADWSNRNLPEPPTKIKPAIFVLKKRGIPEPLLYNPRIVSQIPTNGTEFSIDLKTGKPIKTPDSISFQLTSTSESVPPNSNQQFEWHMVMQIQGGGFYRRTNEFDFTAPAGNYLTSIKSDYWPNAPDWKGRLENEYFVKLASGNYGRIKLLLGGNGYCVIQAWLNPKTGSRNLEFDSEKVAETNQK